MSHWWEVSIISILIGWFVLGGLLFGVVKYILKWKLRSFNVSNVRLKFLSIWSMPKLISLKHVRIVNLKIPSKSCTRIVILLINSMSKFNSFLNMCLKDKHRHQWTFYVMTITSMECDQVTVLKLSAFSELNQEKLTGRDAILTQYSPHSLIWSHSKYYKKIVSGHHYPTIRLYFLRNKDRSSMNWQDHKTSSMI